MPRREWVAQSRTQETLYLSLGRSSGTHGHASWRWGKRGHVPNGTTMRVASGKRRKQLVR